MGALITGLSSLLQPALNSFVSGLTSQKTNSQNSLDSLITSQAGAASASGSFQPAGLAQLLATLQKLQQSNPSQYAQVTGQIASNLQTAAQSATKSGNTKAANFLNQLATDFSNAAKSGQLPSVQDLAQAVGGGHRHHPSGSWLGSAKDPVPTSTSTTSLGATSSGTTGQSLDQLLASLQNARSQSSALNPLSIIDSTLSAAGISVS
jgi:hypothetical protein